MILKEIVKPKSELTTISETATLEEALDILESSGFRCVPILDKTGKLFRGNIYKMHIYRHKSRGGDMQLPVTQLLKNASKFISIDSAFFNIFFTIKDLPYIAVLDENNNFYGILTHSSLLNTLSQSWNVNNGSYVLTVLSSGDRGDLAKISKIITRYSSIASCISLDLHESNNIQRILFTLPSNVDEHRLKRIVASLKRNKFEVTEIENLHA
ncbi:cyclic di-AMP binding protein CbpA [Ligilactobacillus sp. LYQ135]